MPNDTLFDLAPIKTEGEKYNPFGYTDAELAAMPKPKYDTTWIERIVPREVEEEAHELLTNWLVSKGYDIEEL